MFNDDEIGFATAPDSDASSANASGPYSDDDDDDDETAPSAPIENDDDNSSGPHSDDVDKEDEAVNNGELSFEFAARWPAEYRSIAGTFLLKNVHSLLEARNATDARLSFGLGLLAVVGPDANGFGTTV